MTGTGLTFSNVLNIALVAEASAMVHQYTMLCATVEDNVLCELPRGRIRFAVHHLC